MFEVAERTCWLTNKYSSECRKFYDVLLLVVGTQWLLDIGGSSTRCTFCVLVTLMPTWALSEAVGHIILKPKEPKGIMVS